MTIYKNINTLDISGEWNLKLDPEEWEGGELSSDNSVTLPGSLQEQGFGNDPSPTTEWVGRIVDNSYFLSERYGPYRQAGNIKYPCWLQPKKVYKGTAWYQRKIIITESMANKPLSINLERCHWESQVWIDSHYLGNRQSLSAPHVYRYPEGLTTGEHLITIRIDNRMIINIGLNSHSITDHSQTNWNGVIGKITLSIEHTLRIDEVQVYPNIKKKTLLAKITIADNSSNVHSTSGCGQLMLQAYSTPGSAKIGKTHTTAPLTKPVCWDSLPKTIELELPMGDELVLWDAFTPYLYNLDINLQTEAFELHASTSFGMMQVSTSDTHICINNRPTFLRGTLECAAFPKNGYPPTDVESWKGIISTCKKHGLNHIRFHSWCPPKAAFIAGDELGIYFQVECASWANTTTSLGNGGSVDEWLYKEGEAINKEYGNHPSFVLMAYGNEPAGPGEFYGGDYLTPWCEFWRKKDPRRLHTSGAGNPKVTTSDYHNIPDPQIHRWNDGLTSRINSERPNSNYNWDSILTKLGPKPTICHEPGQWCAYPNFDEIKKYTGFLEAKNFEIFRDFLEEKGMQEQAEAFLMASGKLQVLCYKSVVEAALRTKRLGGFQLLGLNDFPGQGTALVGVLDVFWDKKAYVNAFEFSRFCNETVPLVELEKYCFSTNEEVNASVKIAHFGPVDMKEVKARWTITNVKGKVLTQGLVAVPTVKTGELTEIGVIKTGLEFCKEPSQLLLKVELEDTEFSNQWSIFAYPPCITSSNSDNVIVTSKLDKESIVALKEGKTVWLQAAPETVQTEIESGFSSIYWNTAWTRNQAPHTLGILCDPDNPAFACFPTDYHSDWQWWSTIRNAKTMELDKMGWIEPPLIQMVPNWFDPKNLALAFEAKLGKGKLLVSSINFNQQADISLKYLQMSLLSYIKSDNFLPKHSINLEDLSKLFISS